MPTTQGPFDVVFANGTVVNHDGVGRRDVAVRDGRIASIGPIAATTAGEIVDCAGLHILPGVIDTQVHFREPGAEHKEDLESGSRAAVLGGVTAVFEMPNTSPATTTAATLADKVRRATGRMHCDFAFFVGGTHENAHQVAELERLPGAAGIKVFMGSSTGDLLVGDDDGLRAILSRTRRRVSVHAEDEPRLKERMARRVEGDPASHPVWRDEVAALRATERLVVVARETGARVHLLHVSTAEEMDFIRHHKDYVSVEVTPQHLTFDADDYPRLGARLQMNPPVRDARHREALWRGLAGGTADILGSDHAPHTRDEKAKPYPASPSGMPGVQTLVPVMLDCVTSGRLTIERFVDLTAAGPARLFQIAGKGRIAVGYDADFTVVDLKRRAVITDAWVASRAGWTPFAGRAVTGWPVGTVVRGRRVMWDGEMVQSAMGKAVRFGESLPHGAGRGAAAFDKSQEAVAAHASKLVQDATSAREGDQVMKAKDVMTTEVVTVNEGDSIQDTAKTLLKYRISGAPVVNASGSLVGIVSEGDLARRAETGTEHRRSWWLELLTDADAQASRYIKEHGRKIGDVMTREVVTARPDSSLAEISTLLERNHVKRVPIVDGGNIVGIVSRANLLRAVATIGVQPTATGGDDGKIRQTIIDRLRDEPWYVSPINVMVSGGKVGLWGLVGSDTEKTAARVAAETAPGVVSVDDHLAIRSDSYPYH